MMSKSLIMYIIFGALTTAVNFVIYYTFYNVVHVSNVISVITAWFFAVTFAFITNKLFVFESKSFDKKILFHEISTFFGCRITTGILDVLIMYVSVDLLTYNAMFSKLTSEIIINVLNYVASKVIIFGKNKNEKVNR
ncbi:MAG: GtrA family protein [Synergistaceae bacterium]|nr:GtrA family protein [Synergistaceae bacterium]